MDRVFFYPGELLQDTDLLNLQKNAMIGIGAALEMMLGQNTIACGFSCSALSNTAVSGSAFAVSISRGFLSSYQEVDPNAYGTLGADASRNVMKCGVNLSNTNIGLTNSAPSSGQSINYLVSAGFSETDGTPIVLPYYNASNPSSPYAGPGNDGVAQNTVRAQTVVFQVTAGSAASTGSQTTPAAPSGYVPLFVVTVTNGETAVVGGNIAQSPIAPIIPYALQTLSPGFSHEQVFTSNGTFTVPAGVTKIKVTAIGGGGAGAGTDATSSTTMNCGAGGSGGAEAIGIFNVTPGAQYAVTLGAAGTGVAGASGNAGGSTTFGSLLTAPGGQGGYFQTNTAPPFVNPAASPETLATGGYINGVSRAGSDGMALSTSQAVSGKGGGSLLGGGANGVRVPGSGSYGIAYGAGGGGAYAPVNTATAYAGGGGSQGIVIVEY